MPAESTSKNTESSEEQLLSHSGSKNTAFEQAGGHGSHEKSSYSNPTPMPLSERCYVRWLWRSCVTSDLSLLCAHRGAGTSPGRSKDRCMKRQSKGKRDNAKSDPNPNPNPNPGICRTANCCQAQSDGERLGVCVESGQDAGED